MFERFSREAREVVKDAAAEARELGSPTVEAEHILLALARQDPGTSVAGSALAAVGLDYDAAWQALDSERDRSLMAVGIAAGDFDLPPAPLGHRPRMAASAKTALERGLRVSLVRSDRRIGGGHLLLALLQAEAGTVPRALAEAGVDRGALGARTAEAMDRR